MYFVKLNSINELPSFIPRWNNVNPPQLEDLGYDEKITHAKNAINSVNVFKWIKTRKFTNLYEFSVNNKYLDFFPISRAFYKLWELLHDFDIIIDSDSLLLAESPGGFIQAVLHYTRHKYKCYTMSLEKDDNNTPTYHYCIKNNENVRLLYGYDNKGDLYNPLNREFIKNNIPRTIRFITADGGMDDKGFYDMKEIDHYRLFLCEIYYMLDILEDKGTFIMKIFDVFTKTTFDIITILVYAFEECYVVKPETSRPTNSEKYIVCKGYKKDTYRETRPILENLVYAYKSHDMMDHTTILQFFLDETSETQSLKSTLKHFIEKTTRMQIENINHNIKQIGSFYEDDNIEQKDKVLRDWLIKYKLI
jgi:23S rRNA U2552 (ribose-2'-O)-methylase RlmE/FtsJ